MTEHLGHTGIYRIGELNKWQLIERLHRHCDQVETPNSFLNSNHLCPWCCKSLSCLDKSTPSHNGPLCNTIDRQWPFENLFSTPHLSTKTHTTQRFRYRNTLKHTQRETNIHTYRGAATTQAYWVIKTCSWNVWSKHQIGLLHLWRLCESSCGFCSRHATHNPPSPLICPFLFLPVPFLLLSPTS